MGQYSWCDSIRVKARAGYQCELCGSDQMVQAHGPGGDHSDWRKGICLCAEHHADQHPNTPRSLFFTKTHQPYWPNVSAQALAVEFGCHSRTIIRAARRLSVPVGEDLSSDDRQRLRGAIAAKVVVEAMGATKSSLLRCRGVSGLSVYHCLQCDNDWATRSDNPKRCGRCKSYSWFIPYKAKRSEVTNG